MIGQVCIFGVLGLVLSWKRGQKLGELSVINHVSVILDQLSHGCVWPPGLVPTDSSLTSWTGYYREQPGFLGSLLQVVGQDFTFIYGLAIVCLYI